MKELRDAALKLTLALANGASTVTSSPAIDTGEGAGSAGAGVLGGQEGTPEFLLSVPALATGQLPDGHTVKYDIVFADTSDLATNPVTYITTAVVQTGAGGAGAAAATFRFRIPSTAKRFVGFKATNSNADNASAASATLEMLI